MIRRALKEITELKYIIMLGIIVSAIAIAKFMVISVFVGMDVLTLSNSALYLTSFSQVSGIMARLSIYLRILIVGLIFAWMISLTVLFMAKENSIILFDYALTRRQLAVLLIIFSTLNMILGWPAFFGGDIVGIITGILYIFRSLVSDDFWIEEEKPPALDYEKPQKAKEKPRSTQESKTTTSKNEI
ncbi:MAG: hypothetical protein ACTSSI_17055 [Candidatus Helarchaeota archaeon]